MPKYDQYRAGKIISQTGRGITMVEEMLDEADGDPVRPPTAKELHHQALYSGAELMTQGDNAPQPTAQQGDGSGWMLFFIFFIVGMTLLLAAGMGWI